MKHYYIYETKLGSVTFAEEDGTLFCISTLPVSLPGAVCAETPLLKEAYVQLSEYLEGRRRAFDLPYRLEGTAFQKSVWNALLDIPFGVTKNYKQVAETVGNAKAARAVGMACNRNPLLVLVPCHRVLGADGQLVGYAAGLERKRLLLELEAT